jgi:thiamine-monophosphate kinase
VSPLRREFEHIEWIRRRVRSHPRLTVGIGDDAAAIRLPHERDCLVAADMLLEGVHFDLSLCKPEQVGRKALAVNLSDMAAMAARPLAALTSIALPRGRDRDFARRLHEGFQSLADEHDVAIAGGDTNAWSGPLVVDVTVLGEATGSGPVLRSGASVGDWILATGRFGGSVTGRHLSFQPRVRQALELHQAVELHAMIDVSDGLAADLRHVLDESEVGAVVFADAIPIHPDVGRLNDGRSPLEHALTDGEDFELLFCVSPADGRRLLDDAPIDVDLSHIGEIVAELGCSLRGDDGAQRPLADAGWEHEF